MRQSTIRIKRCMKMRHLELLTACLDSQYSRMPRARPRHARATDSSASKQLRSSDAPTMPRMMSSAFSTGVAA